MAINKVILHGETLIDLSGDTVTAERILAGYRAHGADGNTITGTMPSNGAVSATLTAAAPSKTIPEGYTTGGVVQVKTQTKSVTPGTAAQTVTPDAGYLLSSVSVAAAAAGKQMYTGTMSLEYNYQKVKMFALGAAVSSGDTFIMISDGIVHGYGNEYLIPAILYSGDIRYAVTVHGQGGGDGEGGDWVDYEFNTASLTFSFSGNSVTVTFPDYYYVMDGGYRWYLIKG